MSSGAARQASAATSSSLVAYGVASHSALGWRRLARPTAASFQLRMCTRCSSAVGRSRSHVRTVRSSIGAALVRSSPSTITVSAACTSAMAPSRSSRATSSTAPTSSWSASDIPR